MSKDKLAQVFHFDLYGKREDKYEFLNGNSIATTPFKELSNVAPNYFFVNKNFDEQKSYDLGFNIRELFRVNGSGVVSKRDALAFQNTKAEIIDKVSDIYNLSCEEIKRKYDYISWESRDGKVEFCKNNVMKHGLIDELFIPYTFRQFDTRWTYYNGDSKGFIGWPVKEVMQNLLHNNTALICSRQTSSDWKHIFISKFVGDFNVTGNAGTNGSGYYFPLYLYPETNDQLSIGESQNRVPNLNMDIVEKFASGLGFYFQPEQPDYSKQTEETNQLYPIYILDYIYAVLHSPAYREKYKEFLKIDFPRVPYPTNPRQFYDLVDLGSQLRALHLLESPEVENYITQYPIDGDNVVDKPIFLSSPPSEGLGEVDGLREVGRVYINPTQYFDKVPKVAWEFYIGGYQPAQKWLKDRKVRALSFEDILHYQKMIVALTKTADLMVEIDGVLEV